MMMIVIMMMIPSYTDDNHHHHHHDCIIHGWWWSSSWWSHHTQMRMIVSVMMIVSYINDDDDHHLDRILHWWWFSHCICIGYNTMQYFLVMDGRTDGRCYQIKDTRSRITTFRDQHQHQYEIPKILVPTQPHTTQCQDEVRTYSAGTHILKVVKWG